MKYSVPRIWSGETCVILAGGPSLKGQESTFLKFPVDVKLITINDSWRLAPRTSDVNYFCDPEWWTMQLQKNPRSIDNLMSFHDMIYKGFWVTTAPGFEEHPQVRQLKRSGQQGLETIPDSLRHGSNSGYQAINLAVHYGSTKIILLGYDMRIVNGRTHWHNEPRQATPEAFADVINQSFLPHFETLVKPLKDLRVEVINATPDSALKCFPQMTLLEALEEPVGEY